MTTELGRSSPEVWGGVECTINRVGDRFYNQLKASGHLHRLQDLDRIAELGIRTVRYPALWEQVAPHEPTRIDWSWTDQRFGRLRELGIRPIVGFVHHGSGPRYTGLTDPNFATGLAAYARAFAERYPWVEYFTPVNEPLTTARFSSLYGLWYPHARDARVFVRALVNQCRAIVLSMQAIRAIRPDAKLVQTEDLGKAHSTPGMRYRADFENERRWLTWDLLCGRVGPSHTMWKYLLSNGIAAEELNWLRDNAGLPDLVGVNHYVTSERFLDERCERYVDVSLENDGVGAYADLEAVRVLERPSTGLRTLLVEAWERYRLPLAITEAHLGCTREEQMRWLLHVWHAAQAVRENGVDLRAVTVWALFGTYDWNSLLTRFDGFYECGVFDVRGHDTARGLDPRPTALAPMVESLARGEEPCHPALAAPGWWHRPLRVLHPAACPDEGCETPEWAASMHSKRCAKPLLITGATGTLGRAFGRICEVRGLDHRLLSRSEMDICDSGSVEAALDRIQPWAVINTAGYVRVDDAEREPERCFQENCKGPRTVAAACARHDLPFVTFSSDLVFDGKDGEPYLENGAVSPLNIYGMSKARAEELVLGCHGRALVIRTSAFFGPWDAYNFMVLALQALRHGKVFTAVGDLIVSPTYVPDLVNAVLDHLLDGTHGILHLTNRGAVSWAEFARMGARIARIPVDSLRTCNSREYGYVARRPAYSALATSRGRFMPTLEGALVRFWDHAALLLQNTVGRAGAA